MLNPERLVDDLFDDPKLSDINLRAFSEDHLMRLSLPVNNLGGVYSTLVAETTTKYNAFFGSMTNESVKKAISEGLTIATMNARAALLAYLSKLQGLIKFKFGENSPTYQQFFPLGMTEYYEARLDELETIIQRFINAANANLLASHPTEVAELVSKANDFETARDAQQSAFAEIENLQTGRRDNRKNLTHQFTTNLLSIAINNIGNPDNFNNYYNPIYLPLTESSNTISGLIAPGTTLTAINEGIITQSSDITLYNNGNDDLIFTVNNQADTLHPTYQITIAAGNNNRFADLPVLDKYFVIIQNPNTTAIGKWKIKISG